MYLSSTARVATERAAMTSSSLDSGQMVSSSVVAIMTPAPPRLRSVSESSSFSASSRGSTGSVVSGARS